MDADGNPIGFFTFSDPNSGVGISTTDAPPEQVPGAAASNNVLQMDSDVNGDNGFAGFIHAFENETVDTWVPQDWSGFTGISFWLYGNNTGSILFLDILDNRAAGTTTDTAERWSTDIIDDFSGWQLFEVPFESLNRKEIGNGAPNDGLTLTAVHGWAFGVFDSGADGLWVTLRHQPLRRLGDASFILGQLRNKRIERPRLIFPGDHRDEVLAALHDVLD